MQAAIIDLEWLFQQKKPAHKRAVILQDTVNAGRAAQAKIDISKAIKDAKANKPIDKYVNPQEEESPDEMDPEDSDQEKMAKKTDLKEEGVKLKGNTGAAADRYNVKLDTSLVTLTRDSIDAYFEKYKYKTGDVVSSALSKVKNIHNSVKAVSRRVSSDEKNIDKYSVEKYKKYSQAFACIVMFLIGAPLGSIIKKGGLGVPVIVSIIFFIIYYVFTITSEKWAKEGLVDPMYAVWYANIFLLPFGFYFLSRAKVDARLFEWDSYKIWFEKRFRKQKN